MKKIATLAALTLSIIVAAPAFAVPIWIVSGGQLTGARDVDVNGTLYDVDFVEGSCVSLFTACGGTTPLAFTTAADALAAANALLNQVLLDGIVVGGTTFNFDTNAALTAGCSASFQCAVATVYAVNVGNASTADALNYDGIAGSDFVYLTAHQASESSGSPAGIYDVYAVWRVAAAPPAPVPEPATLGLLSLGIALMLPSVRRRRKS